MSTIIIQFDSPFSSYTFQLSKTELLRMNLTQKQLPASGVVSWCSIANLLDHRTLTLIFSVLLWVATFCRRTVIREFKKQQGGWSIHWSVWPHHLVDLIVVLEMPKLLAENLKRHELERASSSRNFDSPQTSPTMTSQKAVEKGPEKVVKIQPTKPVDNIEPELSAMPDPLKPKWHDCCYYAVNNLLDYFMFVS